MAALWAKELAQSLSKVKKTVELVQKWEREGHESKEAHKGKVYRTLKLKPKGKLKMKLSASHIHKQMVKEVEKQNPHLKNVIPLKIQKLPSRLTELQLIWETILKPSTWTRIFLPWYVACYSAFNSANCVKTWYRSKCLPSCDIQISVYFCLLTCSLSV
jgi:transcription termination factor NusB